MNMSFSIKRFEEIVSEAKKIRIAGIGLIGGEIFLNSNWKDYLNILCRYEFYPDIISTKMPLKIQQISYLKSIESKTVFQVSLDSINSKILTEIWRVNDKYLTNLLNMFSVLEKFGLKTKVATTLTKFNDTIESLKSIYDFISRFSIVKSWDVGPAFYSLYKGSKSFESYKTRTLQIIKVKEYLSKLNKNSSIEIDFDNSFFDKEYYCSEGGSSYFAGAECSANLSHLFILPDGKVTICEQLYWNPDFIVGDIRTQNIVEIWNSEKASKFTSLSPYNFKVDSFCKKCNYFKDCHDANNKCWVEIIKAYGKENWDYPDPRCKMAPKMFNNLTFS